MLDRWVNERGIRIDFSRPETPTDNATVESFNGRLRQECLKENGFMSLEDARCKIEAWAYTITRVVFIMHWAG
ncbi:transposase [Rahnella aquatilis]|nr:transposase [Rahnella aquatilis]